LIKNSQPFGEKHLRKPKGGFFTHTVRASRSLLRIIALFSYALLGKP